MWECRLIRRSPYLLHLCLYISCSYAVASQFYFERSLVVSHSLDDSIQRTAWFASLNLYSGLLIAVLQLTFTSLESHLTGIHARVM